MSPRSRAKIGLKGMRAALARSRRTFLREEPFLSIEHPLILDVVLIAIPGLHTLEVPMAKTHTFSACVLLVLTLSTGALAYGDPASGGFIIQAILAGGFAAVAMLHSKFGQVISAIKVKLAGNPAAQQPEK
jgi:hypothetical protein